MAYFQSDDIPTDGPKDDCLHTRHRITVDGVIVKEGRYAIKQTRNIENRVILKRRWNVSQRCWHDPNWMPLNENIIKDKNK